eukprot:365323-Chlamydomonas_euryale.AAC.7
MPAAPSGRAAANATAPRPELGTAAATVAARGGASAAPGLAACRTMDERASIVPAEDAVRGVVVLRRVQIVEATCKQAKSASRTVSHSDRGR